MTKIYREIITPIAEGAILAATVIVLVALAALSLAMGECKKENNGKPCTIKISVKPTPPVIEKDAI